MNYARFDHSAATSPASPYKTRAVEWLVEELRVPIGRTEILVDVRIVGWFEGDSLNCRDWFQWRGTSDSQWQDADCWVFCPPRHAPTGPEGMLALCISRALEARWEDFERHVWEEVCRG